MKSGFGSGLMVWLGLVAAASAQTFENENGRFLRALEPGRVEAVTDYYMPERAGLVRNALTVGETGLCTATFIAPMVVMTAAHCGDAALRAGVRVETYANRSMAVDDAHAIRVPCQRLLATAEFSVGADLALFECGAATPGAPPPGAFLGYVAPSARGVAPDQPVYSLWRNPVTDDPMLADAGMSTLVSPGVVQGYGVMNGAAGPSFPNCFGAPAERRANPIDSQIVVTNQIATTGASGSLSFDPVDDRAVIGPASTGNRQLRTAISMDASFGLGLPLGDRMLFELVPPADRADPPVVPTRLRVQQPDTGADIAALVDCIDLAALHRLTSADREGDRVHDAVLSEADWDWAQPLTRFDFADPLVRARWHAAGQMTTQGLVSLVRGNMAVPVLGAGQAVALGPAQTLTLPAQVSTLAAGRYIATLDATGPLNLALSCDGVQTEVVFEGGADARTLRAVQLDVPCRKPTVSLTARDAPVTLYALSFVPPETVLDFALGDSRDIWGSAAHGYALFTGDGTLGDPQRPPMALNVTPEVPVALTGVQRPADVAAYVHIRARVWGADQAVLIAGAQAIPLGGDWQDVAVPLPDAGLVLRLDATAGTVALIDRMMVRIGD